MRYISSLLFVFLTICSYAAIDPSTPILELQIAKAQLDDEKIILFDTKTPLIRKDWEENNSLVLRVEIEGFSEEFELEKSKLTTDGYKLRAASERAVSTGEHLIYQYNQTQGDQKSCALSWTAQGISALIFYKEESYRFVSTNLRTFKWIKEQDFPTTGGFSCETSESHKDHSINSKERKANGGTERCIDIYFEADHEMYTDLNSSINDTEEWVFSMFNEVQMLFDLEDVDFRISSLKIWDEVDPYANDASTSAMLRTFGDEIQNNYDGRLAHLLTTRGVGGGIAWVGVLCNNYSAFSSSGPYAVSGSLNLNFNNFPNYSWPVNVVAHEIGHNLGSPHTHACAWNGNNTQIDDCGNEYLDNLNNPDFPPEPCYDANNSIVPVDGTVMSYCHITNAGMNLALGFGDQPGDLIRARIDNANCVVGECAVDNAMCLGDLDGNGIVSTPDLLILVSEFGCVGDCQPADIDGDEDVDTADLVAIVSLLGVVCAP